MKKNYSRIFNYVCVVLMLLLLITQFLPFWHCTCAKACKGDDMLSISGYVWFPSDHKDGLTKDIKGAIKDFKVADVVLTPVLILVASVLGIFFCVIKADKPWTGIFPFIAGLSGTIGYLIDPVLKMGQNWQLHLIASVLVLLASLVVLSKIVLSAVEQQKKYKAQAAK